MYHTVNAADINERAVCGHALNSTCVLLALFNCCPESSFLCLSLLTSNVADGAVCTAALNLDNSELNGLTNQNGKITVAADACVRTGNEYAVVVGKNDYTALNCLNNLAFKDLLALKSIFDLLPALVGICSLLGELCDSLDVTYADNESFNFVTNLEHLLEIYRRIVCDLLGLDNAGNLVADVKLNLGIGYERNVSGNGVSCI